MRACLCVLCVPECGNRVERAAADRCDRVGKQVEVHEFREAFESSRVERVDGIAAKVKSLEADHGRQNAIGDDGEGVVVEQEEDEAVKRVE